MFTKEAAQDSYCARALQSGIRPIYDLCAIPVARIRSVAGCCVMGRGCGYPLVCFHYRALMWRHYLC